MNIVNETFKEYFNYETPSFMLESLINKNNKKENDKLVNKIRSNLKDLSKKLKRLVNIK